MASFYHNQDVRTVVEWTLEESFQSLNVCWSVKDISMILGSDLPIFGVDGHPAISVQLRYEIDIAIQ